jgi:hypothetical protein
MDSEEIEWLPAGSHIKHLPTGCIYKVSKIVTGAGSHRGTTIVIYESCESGEIYARQIDNFESFDLVKNMEESSGSNSNFYSPDIKIQADAGHAHYYKDVSHLQKVDIYRILELYNVTNPCVQHAVKKLLCAGGRGAKGTDRDLIEAIDSITRALDMIAEDERKG